MPYNSSGSSVLPVRSANSPNRDTQSDMSVVQLLACTIATGYPSGVLICSISRCRLCMSFSITAIRNPDVPADRFPLPHRMLFVAIIPVAASPSGGQSRIPLSSMPLLSRKAAPSFVRYPASSPALSTFGNTSRSLIEYPLEVISRSNISSRSSL